MKVLNNPQQGPTLVAEFLVGRLGKLIDAPVCEVDLMWISEDHRGWQYSAGNPQLRLEPGFASASLEVPDTVEIRSLEHRHEDDNARRSAH